MPGPQHHQGARCPVLCWWAGLHNGRCIQRQAVAYLCMPRISLGDYITRQSCAAYMMAQQDTFPCIRFNFSHTSSHDPLTRLNPLMSLAGQRRLQRLGLARNPLRALAHLAPQLPALAALDAAGCRLANEAELGRLTELPALASVCLADTPLSRKPVCSSLYMECRNIIR